MKLYIKSLNGSFLCKLKPKSVESFFLRKKLPMNISISLLICEDISND